MRELIAHHPYQYNSGKEMARKNINGTRKMIKLNARRC